MPVFLWSENTPPGLQECGVYQKVFNFHNIHVFLRQKASEVVYKEKIYSNDGSDYN